MVEVVFTILLPPIAQMRHQALATVRVAAHLPTERPIEQCSDWPQLLRSLDVPLEVRTRGGFWLLPPGPLLWIPAWTRFHIETDRRARSQALLFRPDLASRLTRPPAVLQPEPLLDALFSHVAALDRLDDRPEDRRMASVLIDRVHAARALPLLVRISPDSPVAAADGVLGTGCELPARPGRLAEKLGASRRTVERRLTRETGLSAGRWRQQVLLVRAVALLSDGMAVKEVAAAVGYRTPSAFVAAFSRAMGQTPGRWLRTMPRV
jgi:AraC-like DNA-binding protein